MSVSSLIPLSHQAKDIKLGMKVSILVTLNFNTIGNSYKIFQVSFLDLLFGMEGPLAGRGPLCTAHSAHA